MELPTELLLLLLSVVIFLSGFLIFPSFRNAIISFYYGTPFVNFGNNQLALQIAEIYKNHQDPIVGTGFFVVTPVLIIRDLKLVECIMATNFSHFQNRGLFYNEKDDPLSAILGTVDHAQWKCMRSKLTRSFKTMKMKSIFPQLENLCNELVENLYETVDIDGESIEILDMFSRFTIDAIGRIAFGKSGTESDERLLREMVAKAKQPYLIYPFNRIAVAFPKLARFFRMRKHSKEVSDFFVKYVFEIVQHRKENGIRLDDFIQSWIEAELGIPRIAAIGFDLLSAGYADSTSTLAYCLYELSKNKLIQDKAREEINSILEDEEFSYEVLQKMSYVNRIIKEAERKYPVAGIATRVATKSFKVPDAVNINITIPRGMKVFIPIYGIHHDERYYPNPEVFDPDRFTEESIRQRPKYAFLPFGAGPRQCLGYRFAEMLVGIGLVTLLKNFEFDTCPETQGSITFNKSKNTLHPERGVTLKIRRI